MIYLENGTQALTRRPSGELPAHRELLRLISARSGGAYPQARDLDFELRFRDATIAAALALNASGAGFEVFETSRCNPEYWNREPNGAFRLRPDRRPSEGIRDIFVNGPLYGFECATAIVIVFYKAALDTIGDAAYDRLFANTYLFHWNVDRDLGLTTIRTTRFIPGDCLYFDNPDVDPNKMEWQGENVIYFGGDTYYGHGMGIRSSREIIDALNRNRRPGARRSAFLMRQATRPGYVKLSQEAASVPGYRGIPAFVDLSAPPPHRALVGSRLYLFDEDPAAAQEAGAQEAPA